MRIAFLRLIGAERTGSWELEKTKSCSLKVLELVLLGLLESCVIEMLDEDTSGGEEEGLLIDFCRA